MPLQGNLKTVPLSSVLQLLCNENLTGVLCVKSEFTEYQMVINEGDIICATESRKKDRLGVLLVQEGHLTKEQVLNSLEIAKQKKIALGKVLIQKKLITDQTLKKFIYRQVEEILFDVFLWEDGTFDFRESTLNLKWLVVVKLNILKLLLDASRKIDTLSVLKKYIPNDMVVFEKNEKYKNSEERKLKPDELKVLSLIDGKRRVRDMINSCDLEPSVLYKSLHSLLSTGVIKAPKEADSKA